VVNVDEKVVRWPDRYIHIDKDDLSMWNKVQKILAKLERGDPHS